jgi:hypothetical protein
MAIELEFVESPQLFQRLTKYVFETVVGFSTNVVEVAPVIAPQVEDDESHRYHW